MTYFPTKGKCMMKISKSFWRSLKWEKYTKNINMIVIFPPFRILLSNFKFLGSDDPYKDSIRLKISHSMDTSKPYNSSYILIHSVSKFFLNFGFNCPISSFLYLMNLIMIHFRSNFQNMFVLVSQTIEC